ncbi:MAG: response regulator [Rhizonema sp. PD38]|nr:response regulator [Rhizonema sp. PD38]
MKNTKILVVEDEGIVAKDLQNRLKKVGYIVPAIASTGVEAIHQAAEILPDLVLMDIKLKGDIDGIEAAWEIHNRWSIPIIYLTAYADDSTLERAKKTQPFGYLLKPFKERELYTTIEIALNKDKLEKQLKENKQFLTTVIKSIDHGVIASDAQELVTFMNPVAEKLTGWKQEEAIRKDVSEIFKIVNMENRILVENTLKIFFQKEKMFCSQEDVILISKNGIETPINNRITPIENDTNNLIGFVLLFRDITEHKLAIEARREQVVQEQIVLQLEQLNQVKDDFLNTVSHELRTPLSNIIMTLQILKNICTNKQEQRYLEILQSECNHELDLINDLLDLQRIDATTTSSLNPEPLMLQYWLPNLLEAFFVRCQERQQILRLNIPSDMPPLITDSSNLVRIFSELLNNACKYTPAGGEIILSVHHVKNEEYNATHSTIFTIGNSTEIPAAALPDIFEKFYRVPHADIWKQGGTGLGLTLVQKIVAQLHGTIEVESRAGWTTFTLTFSNL